MNGIWGRRLKGRSTHTTTHIDTEAEGEEHTYHNTH